MVTQDGHLFHESVRANLLLADPDATEADLWDALRRARLDELVASLPDGLDTVVGERGYRLSGGERQRLTIARLLLARPRVVILDEATAHLDSTSEAAVQAALSEALAGRTAVVIAHRLSTVRAADLILVVEDGRIVERGTALRTARGRRALRGAVPHPVRPADRRHDRGAAGRAARRAGGAGWLGRVPWTSSVASVVGRSAPQGGGATAMRSIVERRRGGQPGGAGCPPGGAQQDSRFTGHALTPAVAVTDVRGGRTRPRGRGRRTPASAARSAAAWPCGGRASRP